MENVSDLAGRLIDQAPEVSPQYRDGGTIVTDDTQPDQPKGGADEHPKPETGTVKRDKNAFGSTSKPVKKGPIENRTDKHGRPFNPEFHVTDSAGNPVAAKKTGYLRIKPGRTQFNEPARGASSPKNDAGLGYVSGIPEVAAMQAEEEKLKQAQAAKAEIEMQAQIMAHMFFSGTFAIFGDEWRPEPAEREQVIMAIAHYYEVSGVITLPPWLELSAVLGGFAIKRFNQPKTTGRLKRIVGGAKRMLFKIFRRRGRYAPTNSRDDKIRQDNDRESAARSN